MLRRTFRQKRFLVALPLSFLVLLPAFSGFVIPEVDHLGKKVAFEDTSSAGEFSVLTYNIAGLPEIISSAATPRAPSIAEIGRRTNKYDIVKVQEDFNYNHSLYNSGNTHPYRTVSKGNVPFGDGLNTLSKFPVRLIKRVSWNDCTGADCLTPKGFSYMQIEIAANIFLDLYNVHANAYNHLRAAEARRENILQLSAFIKAHSKGKAVIVMGDLNGHYSYRHDNIGVLLRENEMEDSWLRLIHHNKTPLATYNLPESNILQTTTDLESIDKILYRSSEHLKLSASTYKLENDFFRDSKGRPLSDHHPVSVTFSWSVEPGNALTPMLASETR